MKITGFDYCQNQTQVTTPMYMAPELWFPSNIEPDKNKVVVFSLGVSFYYWVTGEYPFAKADYYNKHYRFLITDPKRFWSIKQQDLGKEIPDEVKKVITGMLKASQKRTKRAALIELLMSKHPANTKGWLATMPTVWPAIRAKPMRMFLA